MAERTQRLRVGVFVAGSMAALSGLVLLFSGRPTLFTNHVHYAVVFTEAPGITPGTPVRKSGVRIGEVTAVELDDESSLVRVSVQLDPKYAPRESEQPVINRGILNGDTTLDFVPKLNADGVPVSREAHYPPGSDIPGASPVTARSLITRASDVLPTAQESLVRLTQTLQRFETAAPKIERAVDEFASLARGGREFIPELRQTNTRVQELIGTADPVDPTKEQVTLKETLRELVELLRAVKPVADDLRGVVRENKDDIRESVKAIRISAENINRLLSEENQKAVTETLKNVQSGTADLVGTIRLVALFLDQGEKVLKSVNERIDQAERIFAHIEKAAKPIGDNTEPIVKDIRETTGNVKAASGQLSATFDELQTTLRQLSATLKNVGTSNGSLGKVLSDPSLYNNLNDSVVNLNRVLIRAEKVARDLEVFSDKVARKPELIGIGGVLRPSTGLKESPVEPIPRMPLPPVAPVPTSPVGEVPAPAITPFPPSPLDPVSVPAYRPAVPASDRPPLP